jgi:hypothetical protein
MPTEIVKVNNIAAFEEVVTTEWSHTTPMQFNNFNKKTVSSIPMLFYLPTGSTMKLEYNTNPTTPDWKDLYTFTPNANTQNIEINLLNTQLNNVSMYQLRYSGVGYFIIYYAGEDGRIKKR